MDKTNFLKSLAGLFLLGILFTPMNSDLWVYFLGIGITFGGLWFYRLK
ncbi:MAG: hypothetical protein PVJ67_01090 [Candidatus Pacearchaeota archaeon]|jgi:hypothetical protein